MAEVGPCILAHPLKRIHVLAKQLSVMRPHSCVCSARKLPRDVAGKNFQKIANV